MAGSNLIALIGGSAGAVALSSGLLPQQLRDTELFRQLMYPWIDYLPIKPTSFRVSRQADVAKSVVIVNSASEKQYVTDNIVPHPRVWNIEGYLTSMIPIVDDTSYIKPSLIMQKTLLDFKMQNRETAKLKTDTGEFVDVLMSRLEISAEATYNNAYKLSLECVEFVVLEGAATVAEELGALANASAGPKSVEKIALVSLAAVGASTVFVSEMVRSNFGPLAVAESRTNGGAQSVADGGEGLGGGPNRVLLGNTAEKELRALTQFAQSGDAGTFDDPVRANELITEYLVVQPTFSGTPYSASLTTPDLSAENNPVVTQSVSAGGNVYSFVFVWDKAAQTNYNQVVLQRQRYRNTYPLFGATFEEVAANVRKEEPNLDIIENMRDAELDMVNGSFTDWQGLEDGVNALWFLFFRYDFTALKAAITAQDASAAYDALRAFLYPYGNNYFADLQTKVTSLDALEADVLAAENALGYDCTISVNSTDTPSRTVPVHPNTANFLNDTLFSVYFVSARDRILQNDLGSVSLLIEVFENG